MSKTTVHVLIPFTTKAACGIEGPYVNSACREAVTCKKCRKTDYFKSLPNQSKSRKKEPA